MNEQEYDEEIGEFQNKVRDLIIKTTGCPDATIDGAGCDSGDWRDFTLCEISQGLAFVMNKNYEFSKEAKDVIASLELFLEDGMGFVESAMEYDAKHNTTATIVGIIRMREKLKALRKLL